MHMGHAGDAPRIAASRRRPDFERVANTTFSAAVAGPARCFVNSVDGRGGEIRTPDPLFPKQMRYQAALRPDEG